MLQLQVTANKLNKRDRIPKSLPDLHGVIGVVRQGYTFGGTEVRDPGINASMGKWYKDRDGHYYWGGGVSITGTIPDPPPIVAPTSTPAKKYAMITTQQLKSKYGIPTDGGADYLVRMQLPYPMRLSWDLDTEVRSISCHKLIKDKLSAVFTDILAEYGAAKITQLGIDIYGGCFNFRKMRGGSDWSRHSWGVAIDLDPLRNELKATSKTASFARPEYIPMIDIFYKHGFLSLGREKNYDWMHFEIRP